MEVTVLENCIAQHEEMLAELEAEYKSTREDMLETINKWKRELEELKGCKDF